MFTYVCGDFKQTVNPVSTSDEYPIPKVRGISGVISDLACADHAGIILDPICAF